MLTSNYYEGRLFDARAFFIFSTTCAIKTYNFVHCFMHVRVTRREDKLKLIESLMIYNTVLDLLKSNKQTSYPNAICD